jgi:DNA topoisomerase-3
VVAKVAVGNGVDQSNSRVFDASKVGDHHAIIPDEIPQKDLRLSEDEQKVYSIVMKRFLAAFLPSAEKEETTVTFSVAGEYFHAKESRLVVPGWRVVEGADAETSLQTQFDSLDGVTAFVIHAEADGKSTKPPARYTDATLLKAMEKAGRTVEDEDAREALKECGLGTAATRSGTIKKLLDDTYLQRAGREIYPTGQGMDFIDVVEKIGLGDLTNAEMTGQWENRLLAIEHGEASAPEFIKGIRTTTQRLVKQVKGCDVTDLVIEELADVFVPGTKVPMQSTLLDYVSADGDVRIPKFIRGRYLAVSELRGLFTDLIIGPLQGFVSKKTKKTYPACIRWFTEEKRYEVFFETDDTPLNDAEHPVVGSCYHCGGSIRERSDKYVCQNAVGDDATCQFRLGRTMCSRLISREELAVMLKDGRTPIFDDFISKRNRPFKASLVISAGGKTIFEFPERRGPSRKSNRKKQSVRKS